MLGPEDHGKLFYPALSARKDKMQRCPEIVFILKQLFKISSDLS
jgi:hypothetical protein